MAIAGGAVFYILQQPVNNRVAQSEPLAHPNGQPGQPEAGQTNATNHSAKSQSPADKRGEKPQFSFYRMLPNYHSSMNPATGARQPKNPSPKPARTAPTRAPQKPAKPPKTVDSDDVSSNRRAYVIQAGAFSDRADAEKRSARLTLLGINTQVVDMKLDSGKTVYRVQSQAIDSQKRMNTLRQRLQNNNIDVMVRHVDTGD